MMAIKLTDVRERKKLEKIQEDLQQVLYMFKLMKVGLSEYGIYVPAREVYVSIVNNEHILKGQLEKIQMKIERLGNE